MPGQTATVTQLDMRHPPTVSEGDITPQVVSDFEYSAKMFFVNAKGGVADDQKVARILGCFMDTLVRDWVDCEMNTLVAMGFTEFMKTFRERWLSPNWEHEITAQILGARLDPNKDRFENWVTRIQKLNVTLRGTTSHLDSDKLRAQLEAGLDLDLRILAADNGVHEVKDLQTWVDKVRTLDRKRQNDRKRRLSELEQYLRNPKRSYISDRAQPQTAQPSAPSTSAADPRGGRTFPPRLTDEERKLLQDNDGCFKCRRFYAGHRAESCTAILSGKGYKTLTAQDAARAKASRLPSRSATVASITEVIPEEETPPAIRDTVAAIFPDMHDLSDDADDEDTLLSVSPPPLQCEHLFWKCHLSTPTGLMPTTALIDSGAHIVLIRSSLVQRLNLPTIPLATPQLVNVAISPDQMTHTLTHYVVITPATPDRSFTSKPVHAIVVENLCAPIILGLPFLVTNQITCNYARRECNATVNGMNVNLLEQHPTPLRTTDYLAAISQQARMPAPDHELLELETELRKQFQDVFEPLPHAKDLPDKPVARIRLKDPGHTIRTRNYACPRKWKDAWHTLLQQHLESGRIRPSEAPAGSGAFIIPKADPSVLPRWVNDFRQLNSNTITDCYPLPRISEILTDCGGAKFFASIDMTNSFFQTRMHPDDIKLTAVNTPWGLYEWVVMPMGIKNAPAIHQRRVSTALRPFIGKVCHVYLDDIVIWSRSLADHKHNVTSILTALKQNKLYCNPKKTKLFATEIRFLGHRISANGIEADEGKADRITLWPTPTSTKQVRSFLGLVRYLSAFLPKLAEHTHVLDELTKKEYNNAFPEWTSRHQTAFDEIKALATSTACLTTIDPNTMPENKIFVTTDASDYGSGAVLAFGPTYEQARPVAYDSRSFKGAELNYPVHEKEQLAIVRALAKWRTDLLGYKFEVWTDHRTLQHLHTQRDLSRRQARWLEFTSQYDYSIHYLPGEKNVVADALSRLPDAGTETIASIMNARKKIVHSRFQLEDELLDEIRNGYKSDPYTTKLANAAKGMSNVRYENGFWFIDNRLFVPNVKNTREVLFRLAHDKLGHFGGPKSYASLRDSFFWPHMRCDLEKAYVPACADCQRNKSRTAKPTGPLHPLPVPDSRCDSIAIDFIGPLPKDNGFDCILTITDRLGSDIRIIPTTCSLTARGLAELFFKEWYCENGLPLEIVSDRDKLFVSHFWDELHKLTGVKLKLSSSYHPESDGSSERTNKTVIQCIRFAVERHQKGWAAALPKVRFDIMNTVNKSTGYTPFQLRFGKSPRMIPPLLDPSPDNNPAHDLARTIIEQMLPVELEAKDNLLSAKIDQAHHANRRRREHFPFSPGQRVVLSTANRRQEYKNPDTLRVAKFMPRFDGPYRILATNKTHSTVTLDIPEAPNAFPVFHSSEVTLFKENDDNLFPSRALNPPKPILVDGEQEFFIEKIVDERMRNKHLQYRVRWQGEGPEGDKWLPASELEDCEALDNWQASKPKRPRRVVLRV